MICKNCRTDNAEDAVFCKSCGKRLDGNIICPNCGKQLDGDSGFCNYCGNRINVVQTPVTPAVLSVPAAVKSVTGDKVLNYIKTASVLALAVFSLIFVFLIGIKLNGAEIRTSTEYLYYYFGDVYKDISQFLKLSETTTDYLENSLYVPVAFGTVIAALTIIIVVVCSIIAICYAIKNLSGKSERNGAGLALTAFTSFITGSLLILALSNTNFSSGINSAEFTLGGANIAGVVLCSFSAAIYLVCSVCERRKEIINNGISVKSVLSFVILILTVVVMAVVSLPSIGITSDEFSSSENINAGIPFFIGFLGGLGSSEKNLNAMQNSRAAMISFVFALLMLIAVAAFAAVLFKKSVNGVTDERYKISDLIISILLALSAATFLALAVISTKELMKSMENLGLAEFMGESCEEIKFTFAVPIVVLVLSVLSLCVNIANMCLATRSGKSSKAAEKPVGTDNQVNA